MKSTINRLIRRNYTSCVIFGFAAAIGGIALAYITNDTEPWGTIGGAVCASGLLFVVYAGTAKKNN